MNNVKIKSLIMIHKLELRTQGMDFSTRRQGEQLRDLIQGTLERIAGEDRVEIDFVGVETMTPSFADECFGKLAQQMGRESFKARISLKGADSANRTLVNAILAERLSSAATT